MNYLPSKICLHFINNIMDWENNGRRLSNAKKSFLWYQLNLSEKWWTQAVDKLSTQLESIASMQCVKKNHWIEIQSISTCASQPMTQCETFSVNMNEIKHRRNWITIKYRANQSSLSLCYSRHFEIFCNVNYIYSIDMDSNSI